MAESNKGPDSDDGLAETLVTPESTGGDVGLAETMATTGLEVGGAQSAEGATTLDKGDSLGRYLIIEPLGAGGMGVVYKGYDPELHRQVALKLLRPRAQSGTSSDARARLQREAQAMAQLSHPNILTVYDVGVWQGQVYVAMELVDGVTLHQWLQVSPRTTAELLLVFGQAGAGLAAAHEADLVHRDFKPDNVLVGEDGRVRVMDFGLARQTDTESRMTQSGMTVGTPAYIARTIE